MATIGTVNPTFLDVTSRLDPDNKIAVIAEMLSQSNEILTDMTMVEGNLPTGHKTTIRTGLPEVAWRMLNYGVKASKSKTAQITDTCGMLEAYAEVDKALADLNGNTNEFRLSEDRAYIEAMSQEMAKTIIYGDTNVHPERFVGLAPRYSQLTGAGSSENVLSAGGSTNLTSIYLVVWSKETAHGIYPKGSHVGLKHEDKGQVTLQDANGGNYEGYRAHYKWDMGLTVRDWRYGVRICNIDINALMTNPTTGTNLVKLMIDAEERIPNLNAGHAAWYMNRNVRTVLRHQLLERHKYQISEDKEAGKMVLRFSGIPVRRVDQILNTESKVV